MNYLEHQRVEFGIPKSALARRLNVTNFRLHQLLTSRDLYQDIKLNEYRAIVKLWGVADDQLFQTY